MRGPIYNRLQEVKQCIHEYETEFNRPLNSVFLLAVTKGQSVAAIQAAMDAGQRAFGENYLQEALSKIEALKHYPLEWHFIGNVQKNKAKKIAEHFAWIQTVHSFNIAKKLNDHRPPHLPPINICIQVNISEEPTKSGVLKAEVFSLAEQCSTLPRLKLRGLMAIPKAHSNFNDQLAECQPLTDLFHADGLKHFNLDTLSIGMSTDMRAAIAAGATMVRIGTAIFGERRPPHFAG